MKTARATLFAILFACLCTSAAAQVVKCKGPGGKVIYSDAPCPDGDEGQKVNTQANVLDGSADRRAAERNRIQATSNTETSEVNALLQNPPLQCKFKSFKLSDSKGKILADNAKRECVQNILAERKGEPTSDRNYRLWRDHYDSERSSREQAVTRSTIQSQQFQNNSRAYTCNPNGIGGVVCK